MVVKERRDQAASVHIANSERDQVNAAGPSHVSRHGYFSHGLHDEGHSAGICLVRGQEATGEVCQCAYDFRICDREHGWTYPSSRSNIQPYWPLAAPRANYSTSPQPVRDVKPVHESAATGTRALLRRGPSASWRPWRIRGSAKAKGKPRGDCVRREGPLSRPRCRVLAVASSLSRPRLHRGCGPASWCATGPNTGTGRRRRASSTRARAAARGRFRSVHPPPRRWPIGAGRRRGRCRRRPVRECRQRRCTTIGGWQPGAFLRSGVGTSLRD